MESKPSGQINKHCTSHEEAKAKAELIDELTRAVRLQVGGDIDGIRARAYWEARLPEVRLECLAEALTTVLTRLRPRHGDWTCPVCGRK
ncbi:hypothetical protein B0T45_21155 [Chromobacterium haemolyticum]|uniref:Uncharacterized protein n=1 Tax=Chromobacterium haemolyticum TaxID=394935 RepID=A0A1W0CDQ0_9NEIS|nr:hypothetical protein B0T45_21155 [Chromobacterium haemolyticum]